MKLIDVVGSPRRIWLTSFWGFRPETWGCIGFTAEGDRDRFVREFIDGVSPPGLVAIYVTTTAPRENAELRGKVVGIMEMTDILGEANEFIDVAKEPFVKKDLEAGRWRHSVKAGRAWKIRTDRYIPVAEAAPESYWPGRARHIGARGVELTGQEAAALHQAPVVEASVFGS